MRIDYRVAKKRSKRSHIDVGLQREEKGELECIRMAKKKAAKSDVAKSEPKLVNPEFT